MNVSTRAKAVAGTLLFLSFPALMSGATRIRGPIDASRRVRLNGNVHPLARATRPAGALDPAMRLTGITLVIPLSMEQQDALDALLEAQRDPGSAEYQRWLTPEQFGERFGASQTDIDQVVSWLQGQGLSVDEVARGRNWIGISGTAEQVHRTFETEIREFEVEGETHFANITAPSLPSALAEMVREIRGLNDFRIKPPHGQYTAGASTHYLAPDDLASIYGMKALHQAGYDGTGQKIVVVGQTNVNLSDIAAFRSRFGLPANAPQVILYGANPGTSQADVMEAALDLEWTGAVARNATIYYANSKNVFVSLQNAINQNLAPVISMSYGGCEMYNPSSQRSLAQQANAQGMTFIASSGDSGAAGCDLAGQRTATLGLAVNMPASIPEVTAVGGTQFSEGSGNYWSAANASNGSSALSYIPEAAWNEASLTHTLAASGGGASVYYTKPSWQSGPGVPNDGARDVPDISMSAAANHDGYLIYLNGVQGVVGGTSAPTPAFAGVVAILNQYLVSRGTIARPGLGNINPALYHLWAANSSIFHDVTSGSNVVPCTVGTKNCTSGSLGYNAGAGYDMVTGIGSFDAYRMVTGWASVLASVGTTTAVTSSPASIQQAGFTVLSATVRPATGTSTPTGSVTFKAGATVLGTVALAGSAAALTVPGSKLTTGANPIVASYEGDFGFGGSSGATTVTVAASTTPRAQISVAVNPNPVYQTGGAWAFTVTLTETGGVATTLSTMTIAGANRNGQITSYFRTNTIPARGSVTAALQVSGVAAPYNLALVFGGTDSYGTAWTQNVTVPLNGPKPAGAR